MITVACVRWGKKYDASYVYKLRNMCARHVPEHQFVCFTENPLPDIECAPLPSDLPTWWSKVGLFRPGLFRGDVLYLDLDVVIRRSLAELVALLETDRSKLWALDDFSYSVVTPKRGIGPDMRRLLGGDGTVNSSVMLWNGDAPRKVWDDFRPEKMDEVHGDQNWITQALWPDINLIPPGWAHSYKYGGSGAITVFHGVPKPDDVHDDFVREHWK